MEFYVDPKVNKVWS